MNICKDAVIQISDVLQTLNCREEGEYFNHCEKNLTHVSKICRNSLIRDPSAVLGLIFRKFLLPYTKLVINLRTNRKDKCFAVVFCRYISTGIFDVPFVTMLQASKMQTWILFWPRSWEVGVNFAGIGHQHQFFACFIIFCSFPLTLFFTFYLFLLLLLWRKVLVTIKTLVEVMTANLPPRFCPAAATLTQRKRIGRRLSPKI